MRSAEPKGRGGEDDVHRTMAADQFAEKTEDIALLVALSHAGIKQVSKLEFVPKNQSSALVEQFGLPNARTYEPIGVGQKVEVFFGARPGDVDRALELAARMGARRSRKDELETQLGIGRLLGYPDCRVAAFAARESPRARDSWA